jgi:hypothetical protein
MVAHLNPFALKLLGRASPLPPFLSPNLYKTLGTKLFRKRICSGR